MSAIEARCLAEDDHEQWDQFVDQSQSGTIFHSSSWITTSADFLRMEYRIIGAFREGELVGGCTFYKRRMGKVLTLATTSIPLSPYGGFILPPVDGAKVRSTEAKRREILTAILEILQSEKLPYIKILNSPALDDIREFKVRNWRERVYYTYAIPLEGDIVSTVDRSVKKTIRKAQNHEITVTRENDIDAFWRLNVLTYEKQGRSVPFQREHLDRLMNRDDRKDLGELWIARSSDGDPVSGAFQAGNARHAHGIVGASDPSFLHTGANTLLLVTLFQDLQERGFREIDIFGATAPQLSAFYSSFNPRLVPYYSLKKVGIPDRLVNLISSVVH